MKCHFQDFVTRILIYIFLADSLHCLLGWHAVMKHAAKWGVPCDKELRVATGQQSAGTETISPICHKDQHPAYSHMCSEANPFSVKCSEETPLSLMGDLEADDLAKPFLDFWILETVS